MFKIQRQVAVATQARVPHDVAVCIGQGFGGAEVVEVVAVDVVVFYERQGFVAVGLKEVELCAVCLAFL